MTETTPECRAVRPEEFLEVHRLWVAVFGGGDDGYFPSYLSGDPWFSPRYCRVAKADGRIVSSVHICPRPIRMSDGVYMMGGIANVATLPEFRRRGLSSELLRQSVQVMEEDGFLFSTLGTGRFSHYARYGWERIRVPRIEVGLSAVNLAPADRGIEPITWQEWLEEGPPVYQAFHSRLPLHFERTHDYWEGWLRIRYEHRSMEGAVLLGLRRNRRLTGYFLGRFDRDTGRIEEIECAVEEPDDLKRFYREAIRVASSMGAVPSSIRISAPACSLPRNYPDALGKVATTVESGWMIRSFGDPANPENAARYRHVRSAMEAGNTAWWEPDAF